MSKIIEIKDEKGVPHYYDFGTKNESFLLTCKELKALGIKKWYQCLEVKFPQFNVQDMDPYDENLSGEDIGKLVLECRENIWFYAREVHRVPAKGAPHPYRFELQRAAHAAIWCYDHSIDFILNQPRQTHKTTTAIMLSQHSFIFLMNNVDIPFLHVKDSEAVRNAGMLRDYIYTGPKWANPWIHNRKPPGLKSMRYEAHKNSIKIIASSDSPDKARDALRGTTLFVALIDEWEYIPYIDTVIEGAAPAMISGRVIARDNDGKTCIMYTSTPGNLDTASGKAAQKTIDATPRFSERYYDLSDEQLQALFDGTHNPDDPDSKPITMFYIEFRYQQLRKDEKWLAEQYEAAKLRNKFDEYKRGILLMRYRGSEQVLFRQEDMDYINEHVLMFDHEIMLLDKYILYVYNHEVKHTDLMSDNPYFDIDIPYLVGIDIAAGTGGDNTSITIVHPYTLKIVAECKSPYMGTFDLMRIITELARMLPRCLFCPEANSIGKAIIDFFQESPLIGRVYHDPRLDISKNATTLDPVKDSLKEKSLGRQYIGTNVTPEVRKSMFELLKILVRDYRDKLNTQFLVNDIRDLTILKNGKIAADSGCHDDCVMSYLHTVYVLTYGSNLERFGINKELCLYDLSKRVMDDYEKKVSEEKINNLVPYDHYGPEQQMLMDIIESSRKNDVVDEYGLTRSQYKNATPEPDNPYMNQMSMSDLSFFMDVNNFGF